MTKQVRTLMEHFLTPTDLLVRNENESASYPMTSNSGDRNQACISVLARILLSPTSQSGCLALLYYDISCSITNQLPKERSKFRYHD